MIVAIFIISMMAGLAIGLPIAVALLFCAVATAMAMGGADANPSIVARWLMNGTDQQTMMALPFFIIAGEIMNRGGLTTRIIALCNIFVGRVRGGLGYVTILACLMFASMVGSAVAACAALGSILIPMMAKSGYSRPRSAALVASSNLVAPIMPPSVPLIVFGIACANSGLFKSHPVSIKSLFMGGIAPAVYLSAVTAVVWFIVSRKEKNVGYDMPRPTFREAARAFLEGIWALGLPVIILVGLRSGLVTATEAGVVASVYAIVIGALVYRELTLRGLMEALVSSAKMSAVVMFLAASAGVAAYYMMISGIPEILTSNLDVLVDNPTLLMVVMMLIVVVVGLAMDVVPSILILTPIMLPLVDAAGINPVVFGEVFVMMNVLGLTSPPVGPILNVACATGKVKMDQIIGPTMPYFITQTALCFLLALFPALVEVPLNWDSVY
ncbi:MAG: TRAP transporter large permease [Clostridiales Family XIII bacterium]|jgi:tripartite ATP-independent transporter DctM subunit|nr:TRAP transporter large permease [Clostridiales Family XIII bacterium]